MSRYAMFSRADGTASTTILLVADAEEVAENMAACLGKRYTVDLVPDCETALRTLDTTIDIVLVARDSPDGMSGDLVTAIQMRELDCGVVLVAAVEPAGDTVTLGVDAFLATPVDCAEICCTVARVRQLVQYDRLLTEFFAVASKKARLEKEVPTTELKQMHEYQAILARSDALKRKLAALTSAFTPSQFAAMWNRCAVADRHGPSKPTTE